VDHLVTAGYATLHDDLDRTLFGLFGLCNGERNLAFLLLRTLLLLRIFRRDHGGRINWRSRLGVEHRLGFLATAP
jgi:hypothetical protein